MFAINYMQDIEELIYRWHYRPNSLPPPISHPLSYDIEIHPRLWIWKGYWNEAK